MIKLTNANTPFATEQAAKIQASRMGLEVGKYLIVPNGDGYAIETPDVEAPAEESAEVVTTEVNTESNTETVSESPVVVQAAPAKHRVTRPWKPSGYLEIPERLKVPGRRYRWCKKDKPGNIDKKIAEGWTIDKELTKKMQRQAVSLEDGKGLDSTLQVREMVVMWIPEETALARQKYYADRSNAAHKSAQDKYRKEAKDDQYEGSGSYGDVKITHGG